MWSPLLKIVVRWCGRSHVIWNEGFRRARIELEILPGNRGWLLRKDLMDFWEWPWGGKMRFWYLSSRDKDRIIAGVGQFIVDVKREPFEVEKT